MSLAKSLAVEYFFTTMGFTDSIKSPKRNILEQMIIFVNRKLSGILKVFKIFKIPADPVNLIALKRSETGLTSLIFNTLYLSYEV
jgi:hypothetical protein